MSTCTGGYCKCEECRELLSNWAEKFLPPKGNPFLEILKPKETNSESTTGVQEISQSDKK